MEGESQIDATSLVRLCDLIAPLVLILCTIMRKANISGYISEV